ncbi:chromosome partitioning protein [Albimonas donghaensis]|uniref:Chromosome partitioning protein n=1 Tax=Albimonas donghaensis TaxID=356660 RepID=A0A1H2YFI6_9RHOB|nr:division plane positioning ATPase MipZ [Albimonas donghaensis]MAS43475.1 ATPase [Paracoccaceae bacterium]MBR25849.1 ATPase [Paracoccaceae bacterium]SDX03927.1 chromosome partitioning protein [Albimonas donghaensis]
MAHVIVTGNEKGGSGKSTTAMHLFAAIARAGFEVGALDLDLRQTTFFRYLENRAAFARRTGQTLALPRQIRLRPSDLRDRVEAEQEEERWFAQALAELDRECDFVIIDCPGADSYYSQMAHASADTLITPINDSLVDFDLLARMDPETGQVLGPSIYSEMVWQARRLRAGAGLKPVDWVVLRNRLSHIEARNKRKVGDALESLSKRIGYRVVPGFSERVIFREMFLNGLTLLDLRDQGFSFSISHVAARQEIRDLIKALDLPGMADAG